MVCAQNSDQNFEILEIFLPLPTGMTVGLVCAGCTDLQGGNRPPWQTIRAAPLATRSFRQSSFSIDTQSRLFPHLCVSPSIPEPHQPTGGSRCPCPHARSGAAKRVESWASLAAAPQWSARWCMYKVPVRPLFSQTNSAELLPPFSALARCFFPYIRPNRRRDHLRRPSYVPSLRSKDHLQRPSHPIGKPVVTPAMPTVCSDLSQLGTWCSSAMSYLCWTYASSCVIYKGTSFSLHTPGLFKYSLVSRCSARFFTLPGLLDLLQSAAFLLLHVRSYPSVSYVRLPFL